MTNPRYSPRSFAVNEKEFGRKAQIDWKPLDEGATTRAFAQLDASQLQHRLSYGILVLYMPRSNLAKLADLASAVDVPYDRLQKMLTGRVVMQLEDIGRLRILIGHQIDYWMLRGLSAQKVHYVEQAWKRIAEPHFINR